MCLRPFDQQSDEVIGLGHNGIILFIDCGGAVLLL